MVPFYLFCRGLNVCVRKNSGHSGQNSQSFSFFLLFLSFCSKLQKHMSLFFIIGKDIMLDPTTQKRQVCCCSAFPDETRLVMYSQQAHAQIYTTYTHIYSCWHHGHTSLAPTCGLTPVAAPTPPYTCMHTERRTPLTQERVRKEFNKMIKQIVMVKRRAWLDKCTDQQTIYMQLALSIPFVIYFPTLVPLQITSPKHLLFPTFGFSLKRPVINPA